jgi:hypothetical protein
MRRRITSIRRPGLELVTNDYYETKWAALNCGSTCELEWREDKKGFGNDNFFFRAQAFGGSLSVSLFFSFLRDKWAGMGLGSSMMHGCMNEWMELNEWHQMDMAGLLQGTTAHTSEFCIRLAFSLV